ncbi:MAG: paraquat-inducible protein A [Deltaproteobacteria bacterium]|nr:paraquat-inducible protein A [Deltaproteobacteria bacterium]
MNPRIATARQLGLMSCHDCRLLIETRNPQAPGRCPRCGAHLHLRKPNSLTRVWALICAAIILYIPANILPITITSTLGIKQKDTILSGVIFFLQTGSWEIAAVIFIASVFVPFAKLMILIYLSLSVQFRSTWRPKDRTALYRLTECVGRWSMVDIYVLTILVALVKLGAIATIEAGPAAIYFASVVVITMFAAESFDPRLIWDVIEEDYDGKPSG